MRRDSVPLILGAFTLAMFVLWWAGSGTLLADFGGDNAVYWLTANHYSPWSTPTPPAAAFAAHSIYPPLYPWVMALAGGGVSLAAAHRVTALIVLLAGLAGWSWLRVLGVPRMVALLALVLLAMTRIVLLEGLELHSEHLYLALWLAAAALCGAPGLTPTRLLVAALLVGAACLTRSFGLTLVASFLWWLLLTRPRGAWPAALLAVAPLVLQNLLHQGNARYLGEMFALYEAAGPGARLMLNVERLWPAWQGAFGVVSQPGFLSGLPLVLLLAALPALGRGLRAKRFDAWSVLAYTLLMAAWPYPAEYERMCYPLLPFVLGFALASARALWPARLDARLAVAPVLALWLAAIAPFAALVGARLATPPADPGLAPYLRSSAWFDPEPTTAFPTLAYQRAVSEALRGLPARLPGDACVRAIKPSVVAALSGLAATGFPPYQQSTEATRDALATGPCRYLFILMFPSPSFPEYYYPLKRLEPWLEILAVYPNPLRTDRPAALLARLRDTPP
ncbi:MAG: hypothetical protein AB7I01_00185 [Gammaproteobacteria bacterium]